MHFPATSDDPVSVSSDEEAAGEAAIGKLSQTVRRQRVLLAAAVVAATAAGGGLAASAFVKSPAQQASETRPPAASLLTAPVVSKVLANTVTVRGSVVASGDITVSPQPAASSGGSGGSVSVLLVSKVTAHAGDQIRAGQVLVEVSGRPIIALPGLVPPYRDLKPNMDGDDVSQLQQALIGLGYSCGGDVAGHFGAGTKSALTAFYGHLGYTVPTTGGPNDAGDHQNLQSAADAVTTAQRTAAADKVALDKANKALAAAISAQHSSATSGGRADGSISTGAAAQPSSSASATGGASNSGGSGGTGQESPVQAAQDAVQQAQTAYQYALQDLGKAQKAQADLVASTGAMAPAAEFVFVPSFPVRLTSINAALGQAVSGPLLTLAAGQPVVSALLQPGQNDLVKPGMKAQLDAEALGDETAKASVRSVGAFSNGAANSQSNSNGSPNGSPNGAQGGAGSAGVSQQSASGLPAPSSPGYPMVVTPDQPLPQSWIGQNIRVTITGASTPGPVTSVPLAAVSTGADARSSVTVVGADGSQRRVLVTAGVSADGDVEVTPVTPGTLKVGDTVVVGQAQQ